MQVDDNANSVGVRSLHQLMKIVQVGLVVNTRARVFNRFPGHDQPLESQTPTFQPAEMFIRLRKWKGTPDEGDCSRIRRRLRRSLTGATEIDAAQYEGATLVILKSRSVSMNATGRLCFSGSKHQDEGRSRSQQFGKASSECNRGVRFVPCPTTARQIHIIHKNLRNFATSTCWDPSTASR